jgi:hypothetical protein
MMSRFYFTALAAAFVTALLLTGCAGNSSSSARRAGVDLDNPDQDLAPWVEDTAPPPPAYDVKRLIGLATPPGSNVRIGIDPKTIAVNLSSGVVRYVVVARGTAAVNAMYEGIHCASGEFRVYARQVQGQPWQPASDSAWRSMDEQAGTSALLRHPLQLAEGGICNGPTITATADQMAQLLRAGELRPDLYQR